MINLKVNSDQKERKIKELTLNAGGTVEQITAELFTAIRCIYDQLMESHEESAEFFKDSLLDDMEFVFSSDEEREETLKKEFEAFTARMKKEIKDIFKSDWE